VFNNLPPQGNFIYRDSYEQVYYISWTIVSDILDVTVVTEQPYIWGQPITGEIVAGSIYYDGIVTVERTVLQSTVNGYTIIAEGSSQYTDKVRTRWNCGVQPIDPFFYHVDQAISDEVELCVCGSGWINPDIDYTIGDDCTIYWGDVDDNGNVAQSAALVIQLTSIISLWPPFRPTTQQTITNSTAILEFIDVWS